MLHIPTLGRFRFYAQNHSPLQNLILLLSPFIFGHLCWNYQKKEKSANDFWEFETGILFCSSSSFVCWLVRKRLFVNLDDITIIVDCVCWCCCQKSVSATVFISLRQTLSGLSVATSRFSIPNKSSITTFDAPNTRTR